MQKNIRFITLLVLSVCLIGICSCGKNIASGRAVAPFADVSWSSSVSDVIRTEGESTNTYDSVYGGTTYSYPKEFDDKKGTVKYMFDDKDALMCIAWAYGSDDEDELYELYNTINQSVNDVYGESNYSADTNATNYGNVWRLESGNIILSTMITSETKALQYAYLNPAVSNTEGQ